MSVAQERPVGAKQGRWGATAVVVVKVPGVQAGQEFEAEFTEADPARTKTSAVVLTDDEVSVTVMADLGTLAQAQAEATRLSALSQLTIQLSPDSPPLTASVPRWSAVGPFLFRDVKMKKGRGKVTFTGRLIEGKGAPVSRTSLTITQSGADGSGATLSEVVEVGRGGRFSVTTNTRPKRGFIGLVAVPFVKTWGGHTVFSRAYSKPFAYKP